MPQPPSNRTGIVRVVGTFTPGGGYQVNAGATNLQKSNSPVKSPPQLIGSDSARVDLVANPSNLLYFPNIVRRTNNANPNSNLTGQGALLSIPQGATLLFVVNGLNATPVATTTDGVRITNPLLGAGKYKSFQAQVDPSITSGIVTAQLYYQP